MLKLSQPNISEDAIARVAEVLRDGYLVHGPECDAFEKELADYLGCDSVVLVSSGTAALHVALLALDVGPGDAVLVPDFTFPASANSIAMTGAKPVIVDVNAETYTISAKALSDTIAAWDGPETLKAIMPVHEFGAAADMREILSLAQEHGLHVVEDAACALGARDINGKVGQYSEAACFSFHPRKTLTTGEGGAIATNDAGLACRMRRLRNHGMERSTDGMRFLEPATNYRMTNFQGALGRSQLPCLDEWISLRHQLCGHYLKALSSLEEQGKLMCPEIDSGHSLQTFMVVLDERYERSSVIAAMRERGVECNLGAQSLTSLALYGPALTPCVHGPRLYEQGLALPMFEKMTDADVAKVCESLMMTLAE